MDWSTNLFIDRSTVLAPRLNVACLLLALERTGYSLRKFGKWDIIMLLYTTLINTKNILQMHHGRASSVSPKSCRGTKFAGGTKMKNKQCNLFAQCCSRTGKSTAFILYSTFDSTCPYLCMQYSQCVIRAEAQTETGVYLNMLKLQDSKQMHYCCSTGRSTSSTPHLLNSSRSNPFHLSVRAFSRAIS